jgi:translation initiation factor IF-2
MGNGPNKPNRPIRPRQGAPGRKRRVVIEGGGQRPGSRQARNRGEAPPKRERQEVAPPTGPATVPSGVSVRDLSQALGVPAAQIIKIMMNLGQMVQITQSLSDEEVELIGAELGREITVKHAADEEELPEVFEDAEEDLAPRPPVVTIMGHVDHGKTSLLDAIRETEVAAGEAGGITQHIGAYQVHHGERTITFLDTPGHEAFTAMRARGASVTDIAVIVVAADDGVMPQTTEAIDHAKAAGVPIMVAVNKIDKEGADPNRVRGELAQQGLTPADWGGETEFRDVSAKTREGLDGLLEDIVTIAELQELRANPQADATGAIVESRLDPGRGPVVTVLVQRGTLRVGDALVAGATWGRVRAMHDYRGERVKEARPGDPVEVLGFDDVPEAGERVRAVDNERVARSQAAERATRLKAEALARRQGVKVSLEDVFARAQRGEAKELNLVLKADVAGSLGALLDEVAKLPQDQVQVNPIHDGVGGITESDVMLASASDAVIVGFNVRPVAGARQLAEREGVEVRTYSVIYRVVEDLRAAMEGLLEPEEVEETLGTVEVRETFRASRIGTIAGCYVTEGTIRRGGKARLVRDGTVVYDGRIGSLRRFKEDVREVDAGYECGIVLENYQDVKQGDVIEVYDTKQVDREL